MPNPSEAITCYRCEKKKRPVAGGHSGSQQTKDTTASHKVKKAAGAVSVLAKIKRIKFTKRCITLAHRTVTMSRDGFSRFRKPLPHRHSIGSQHKRSIRPNDASHLRQSSSVYAFARPSAACRSARAIGGSLSECPAASTYSSVTLSPAPAP